MNDDELIARTIANVPVVEASVRVIQCFCFHQKDRPEIHARILNHRIENRVVWKEDRVNPDWVAEIPSACVEFLAGNDRTPDGHHRYFLIGNDALNFLFPQLTVEINGQSGSPISCGIDNKPGWEIYLGTTGVGFVVFSFCVRGVSVDKVRQISYTLSQTRSFKVVDVTPTKKEGFSIPEWANRLVPVSPLAQWRKTPLNTVYVAVRFGSEVDFTQNVWIESLSSELESLAQAEERGHPPGVPGQPQIPAAVLNAKHWAACSYVGSAHFLADQKPRSMIPGCQSFDQQRLYNVVTRYFLAFLAAFAQRLTLERLHEDGYRLLAEVGRSDVPDHHRDRNKERRNELLKAQRALVRDQTLAFAIQGHLFGFSFRDSINRYYDLAQRAQRVAPTMELVRLAIRDLDNAWHTSLQTASLGAIEATQHDVELIELFIVTVYALEFGRTIGELIDFPQRYLAFAVPTLAACGAGFAILSLRLFRRKGFWRGFGLAVIPLLLFGGVGWALKRSRQEVPPQGPPERVVRMKGNFISSCPPACLATNEAAANLASEAYKRESAADWEGAGNYWEAAARRVELDNQPRIPPQTPRPKKR